MTDRRSADLWQVGTGDDLRRRSVRSGVVQLAAQPFKVALFMASGMALARLLTPADFGIFAMAMTWIALVMSVQDFGFSAAVLHGESVDDAQLSGLFWTNLRLSLWLCGASVLAAPLVAWFYGEAAVAPVTLALATGILAGSLGWQHRSLLMRQLRFHAVAVVEVAAVAVSVGLSVAAAVLGAGYWALVLQFVLQGVVRSAGLWMSVRWRPLPRSRLGSDRTRIQPFLRYGREQTVTQLIRHVGRNLDRVLVAAVGGARPAGLYDNAFRWSHYPVTNIIKPLVNVAVSSFSRTRESAARYVAAVQDGMVPVLSAVLPALAFIALEARGVILVLLGDQWVDAIPLFRLLALAGFARSITLITRWLYLSEGRTGQQLRWAIVEASCLIPAVSIGVWLGGAYGVAMAFTAVTWLLMVPEIAYCLVGSPMGGRDYLAGVWRPVVATAAGIAVLAGVDLAMAAGAAAEVSGAGGGAAAGAGGGTAAATGVGSALTGGDVVTVAAQLAVFGAAYVVVWLALPGRRRAVARVGRLLADLRG